MRRCALIFIFMVIGAVFESIGIGAIMPLIAIMGQPDFLETHKQIGEMMHAIGVYSHAELTLFAAFLLLAFYLTKNIFMAFQSKFQIDFIIKSQIDYSIKLFGIYLTKPYIYHVDHNTALLLRNVASGGNIVFSGILIPLFALFAELTTVFMIWLMLFIVDPLTAIFVAFVIGTLMWCILKGFRHVITDAGEQRNVYSVAMNKAINQGLGAIKETKVLRKEAAFYEAYANAYKEYGESSRRFTFLSGIPRLMIETVVVVGLLSLIIIKVSLGSEPMDIVPLLGVLALAAFRLMPGANHIVNIVNGVRYQIPLFNELYDDMMEIRQKIKNNEPIVLPPIEPKMPFNDKIEIKDLTFRYPEGKRDILQGVSFTIPKGSFAGIVGPSGAGKTTFVDILLGLLKPDSGSIYVDGKNIYENVRSWQANLAYVPQSIYLIDATIRDNIALGIPDKDIDDSRIEKVLKMAELYDFVQEQPQKELSIVGEGGVKLSGGQRQRIGIARALYQQPDVLVLDEATSALDNTTEKEITKTILKLKGKITIISIAHRISTLEDCDFKIRFDHGNVSIIRNM